MPNNYRQNLILSALLLLLANTIVAAEGGVSPHSQFQVKHHLLLSASMDQPSDLAIADDGRIYVLDGLQGRVVVFENSGSGKVRFTFGSVGSGSGQLRLPMGIAIEGDRLYIADSGNHRIAIFDLNGRFVRNIALKRHKGDEYLPEPIALKVVEGVITWSDRRNHRVCRNDGVNGERLNCWGKRGEGKGEFTNPFQIDSDRDGYLYIVDVLNARIQIFNRRGRYFSTLSRFGLGESELFRPNGIAFMHFDGVDDSERELLFVADSYRGTISLFSERRYLGLLGDESGLPLQFDAAVGIRWHKGLLYVVDARRNRVEIFNTDSLQKARTRIVTKRKMGKDKRHRGDGSSRKNCVTCHLSWAPEYSAGTGEEDGVAPVATQRMCYSCHHGAVIDSRAALSNRYRDGQHPDIHHQRDPDSSAPGLEEREDKMPKVFPLLGDGELYCGSCHTPHGSGDDLENGDVDTLYSEHANPWLRVLNRDGDLCQQCHESKLASTLDSNHPPGGINHSVGIYLKSSPDSRVKGYALHENLHNGLPESLSNRGLSLGGDSDMTCQSCHQIHGAVNGELLPLDHIEGEFCASCHEHEATTDAREARRKGVHPVNIDLEEAVELDGVEVKRVNCITCHSVHNGREESALLTRSTADIETLCSSCHQRHDAFDEVEAKQKGVHAVNMELKEAVTIDGEEVTQMGCLTCHSVHKGKADTPSLRLDHRNGELCSRCHESDTAVLNSDHDLRITASESHNRFDQSPHEAGLCGSCHTLHRGPDKSKSAGQDEDVEKMAFLYSGKFQPYEGDGDVLDRDRICLDCHRDKGVAQDAWVEHFSHPARDLVLRSNPREMPLINEANRRAEFGVIACVTCHEPHRWSTESQPPLAFEFDGHAENVRGDVSNSFLRNKELSDSFCVDCHGLETRMKYKYYHDQFSRGVGLDYLK